ncbi:hypothetical protein [Psychrobacter sp. 16-MNA-CIBAN-0192]|uniref:DUF7687 domain-containing protein n=1 Tax=Psychrobacter sp. 16-MNA-CIBAN-0192 TaxID=3140448 RepID=UPI0033195219
MKANLDFLQQPPEFWAYVRTISQEIGYTATHTNKETKVKTKSILIPSRNDVLKAFAKLGLSLNAIENEAGELTAFGKTLFDYFSYRSEIITNFVRGNLMDKDEAEAVFYSLFNELDPQCPLPMNKQKGDKKNYSYLTGMVNMIIESNLDGVTTCDYDPRSLTTVTHQDMPLRTLSRRVDGALPSVVNPIAIWEIKEYYYTTTFGSRVADGVYESLLDGMELRELSNAGHQKIYHMLIIDSHYTWWECGRSYLCRIIDMLHMGYLDEVIIGKEVVTRLPELVTEWKKEILERENIESPFG